MEDGRVNARRVFVVIAYTAGDVGVGYCKPVESFLQTYETEWAKQSTLKVTQFTVYR
jgi:L-alanine-DL-glutamate epimerase-like enolase superfamily enzyme